MNQSRATVYNFLHVIRSAIDLPLPCRRYSPHQRLRHTAALALVVGLFWGAANSRATEIDFFWTAGNGIYDDPANWTTNGATGPLAAPPTATDIARFTNAATYAVTVDNTETIISNIFNNASFTTATVTFEVGAPQTQLNPTTICTIGNDTDSVTTVYFDSNSSTNGTTTGVGGYYAPQGTLLIGRAGQGTLIVTNGTINAAGVNMGSVLSGRGALVVTGPNTTFSFGQNNSGFGVGPTNSFGNSIVVSNGATMGNIFNIQHGTFRFGSAAGYADTSNNTMTVVAGGKVVFSTGTITIGNGSTFTFPGTGSFSNVVTIGNGGTMDCGFDRTVAGKDGTSHTLFLGSSKGGPGSNNVLRILAGGTVHSVSHLFITNDCLLDMVGGQYGGAISNSAMVLNGDITNALGTVQGYGTFLSEVLIGTNGPASGVLYAKNSLGSMVFSNGLRLLTNAITHVELGANPAATHPVIVASNLTVRTGTFNVTAPGPFTAGTYLLFTNTCNNCTNQVIFQAPTVTNYPGAGFTYSLVYGTNAVGGGTNAIFLTAIPTFFITSVARSGNDIKITWNGLAGDNIVQVSNGGNLNTSTFSNLATITLGSSGPANYTDVGAALSPTNRFYRIRGTQ